jgi:hypothetical protein
MTIELIDNLTSSGTQVYLTAPCGAGDNTITVNRPASTKLQTPNGQFRVIVFDPSNGNIEIMIVDSNSAWSPTWSVTRGAENTIPLEFSQNSVVKHVLTAGALDNLLP